MRVTVCFGQTRVIVPCKGGATVNELVNEACARYKKAIGKTPKYRVKIRQLENAFDGGILDLDDYVYDVAEDRDQLIAIFDEEDDQTQRYNGLDQFSGSGSDGHRSPLSFQHHQIFTNRFPEEKSPGGNRERSKAPTGNATVIKHDKRDADHEVHVGADALKSGSNSNITVRGTTVNSMRDDDRTKSPLKKSSGYPNYYGRRESGSGQEEENQNSEIMITTTNSSTDQDISMVTASSGDNNVVGGSQNFSKNKYSAYPAGKKYNENFSRGSTRQSIIGMLTESYDHDSQYERKRMPPDGRKQNSVDLDNYGNDAYRFPMPATDHYLPPPPANQAFYPRFYNDSQEMFVDIDRRPLGIKVTTYREKKVFLGLLVESTEKDGRSEREGLLHEGDVIVEVNNYVLAHYSYQVAQEIFKDAMKFAELQLRVYTIEERERAKALNDNSLYTTTDDSPRHKHAKSPSIPVLSVVEPTPPKINKISAAKSLPNLNDSTEDQSPENESPGKLPLAARMSLDTLSNNTRKIGSMFEIELRKGLQGLGFSITTRDTMIGDAGPIYVKNILPKGAAIQDGRLRAGDRLLKVNDIDLTGHTQESAVNILRCIEVGSTVKLVVSRHVNTLPRKMKDDPVADKAISDDNNREYFKFEIALNDTGSAGLGISLKGNQSKKTKKDLGIFVKSVFHGGAAYQDGRLQANDQLISVNGQSLMGMTNHEAIDTLRTSMSTVGNVRGMIQMVIARRKATANEPLSPQFSSEASSEISDSLVNERSSRMSKGSSRRSRLCSTPETSSSILSQTLPENAPSNHSRHSSDSSMQSSYLDSSFKDEADTEIENLMGKILPRSSAVISSPKTAKKGSPMRILYSSLRTSNNKQSSFADTVNRYTRSSGSSTPLQHKEFGDFLGNAAIDNHYKPKRITPKSGLRGSGRLYESKPKSPNQISQPRFHSLRYRKKNLNAHTPTTLPKRTQGVGMSSSQQQFHGTSTNPTSEKTTATEVSGGSHFEDDYFRYNDEIPRQIDPNPFDSGYDHHNDNGDRAPSPDITDPDADPFSRESIFRQSISEKRKGAAARDAQNIDMFKALKNKQFNSEKDKKSPTSEPLKQPQTTTSTPLKWVKPTNAKSNHSTNSTPSKPPMRALSDNRPAPIPAKRNLNNSSNLPVTGAGQRMSESGPGMMNPLPSGFNFTSTSPSIASQKLSNLVFSLPKPYDPPNYHEIADTPKSRNIFTANAYSSGSDSDFLPTVRKSNSSDSLMTFGLYSPFSPTRQTSNAPEKTASTREIPYFKPPVLPNPDLKHLAACCAPVSVGSSLMTRRYASPPYYRRKKQNHAPLTARTTDKLSNEQEVQVGPMLGIAKSSSLESLQTAVESFVDGQDGSFSKAQPRVLRGRVLNESFRAALDQSYDMESFTGKPMATLKEEGNGTTVSPLAKTDGNNSIGMRTQEKKRGGKSHKFFGIFRVGKSKRSISSDRNADSNSSASSSPRLTENEVHKKLLEAKREDDFKKHQAENERIQAKAKEMREQQEQKRKIQEKSKSRENLIHTPVEDIVRAPSVPVTAMQRMHIDPKVSYSEAHSGRRSVDPIAMRNSQAPTFDWQSSKRPTSPVDYSERNRVRKIEKKSSSNKSKTNPDYSSLPRKVNDQYVPSRGVINPYRKPGTESHVGALQDDSDGIIIEDDQGSELSDSKVRGPPSAYIRNKRSGLNGPDFNNVEFYNMQKPPASKNHVGEMKSRRQASDREGRSSTTQRKGRPAKPKVGRTLYYDDTDDSASPSSSGRSKTPQPQASYRRNASPSRKQSNTNHSSNGTTDFATIRKTFQREQSPEPPPVVMRKHTKGTSASTAAYRHSVHVDNPLSRSYDHRQPHTGGLRSHRQSEIASFWRKTRPRTPNHEHSDSDSYRTVSPSLSTVEMNRNAVKKLLDKTRFSEKHSGDNIVISPPYNL